MSVQLLDKTRKINKLLHNNNSSKVVFNDICEVLTGILDSNILVISKKGKDSQKTLIEFCINISADFIHDQFLQFLNPFAYTGT